MPKKLITVRMEFNISQTGLITDLISEYTSILDSFSHQFTNIKIIEEYDDESNDFVRSLYGTRYETDKEYKKRLKANRTTKAVKKKIREIQKEKDLAEYLRLKQLFEKE